MKAAGWTRQELTQGDQINVCLVVEPLASDDVLVAEVAQMRDWPAEGRQPQARGHRQHFQYGGTLR
jgi:hypothetical protein